MAEQVPLEFYGRISQLFSFVDLLWCNTFENVTLGTIYSALSIRTVLLTNYTVKKTTTTKYNDSFSLIGHLCSTTVWLCMCVQFTVYHMRYLMYNWFLVIWEIILRGVFGVLLVGVTFLERSLHYMLLTQSNGQNLWNNVNSEVFIFRLIMNTAYAGTSLF